MKLGFPTRVFYGWWLVGMSYPLAMLPIAFVSFGFGFFIKPLQGEFGWSVTQIVLVLSLARLEGGILNPVAGFLIDRWGARRVVLIGQLLVGLGLVLTSQVQELWQYYAAMLIAIGGSSFGAFFPMTTLVVRWFVRRRAFAMSLVTITASGGQMLLPVVAFFITLLGWRDALLVMGLIVWAVGLPLGFLIRNDPYEYGMLPDGDPPVSVSQRELEDTAETTIPVSHQGISWRQALRLQPFWMIGIGMAIWSLYHGSVRVFLIPHIENLGYAREVAGSLILIFFLISLPGRIIFGWIGDHIEPKKLFVVVFLVQALGVLALGLSTQWWHLFFYAFAYEWGVGGALMLQSVIIARYFGVTNFASIRGLMQLMAVAGGFLGPVVGGQVFDATGSYREVFIVLAFVAIVAVPFILLARPHNFADYPDKSGASS